MMILPSPESDKKTDSPQSARDTKLDPPPQYTPPRETTPPPNETTPLPETTPATNYVFLQRKNGSVKGTWSIDPRLRPPPALLSPLPEGQPESARRNVYLHASNGSVSSEIFISPAPNDNDSRPRVSIEMISKNGSVTSKLHAPPTRSPLFVTAYTSNGNITLSLPRSFRGPVTCTTPNGSTRLSPAIRAALRIATEDDGKSTMRAFLGSWEEASKLGPTSASPEESSTAGDAKSSKAAATPDEPWAGDELQAESKNGNVKIQFDDEVIESRTGFLGRLFGF
ncbi:hypothetical protein BD779DRAFT_1676239 [Infundibulicybe gibba]|nr:hypothetical protein BD779DRAFT_1676239 [Infundibulicybe gibba]